MKFVSSIKISLLIFCQIFIYSTILKAELFDAAPLIQMPGDNSDFSITAECYDIAHLVWINYSDSIYTLYSQQIFPEPDSAVILQSITNRLASPSIRMNQLVWSEQTGETWRLNYSRYYQDYWTDTEIIAEDLTGPVKISTGHHRVAWTSSGRLYMQILPSSNADTSGFNPVLIDSVFCDNPAITPSDSWSAFTQVVYEKHFLDSTKILSWEWREHDGESSFSTLSNAELNRNPRFGPEYNLCFETFVDSIWKISYTTYSISEEFNLTSNEITNYYNPMRFTFGIPIRDTLYDYLLVFDSDSLPGNDEIFGMIQVPFFNSSEIINISNVPGNDKHPAICYFPNYGIISVFWIHESINGNEIWWAQAPYELIYGSVTHNNTLLQTFELFQNYPNPFNSVTKISYTLNLASNVSIAVWNINGQLLEEIFSDHQEPGFYEVSWHPADIASGIYFYAIKIGDVSQTKKCILIK